MDIMIMKSQSLTMPSTNQVRVSESNVNLLCCGVLFQLVLVQRQDPDRCGKALHLTVRLNQSERQSLVHAPVCQYQQAC